MVDHLNLVVQRIELDGGPRAGLLAERLEHLIGRHVGELDGDLSGWAPGGAVTKNV